MRMSFRRRKMKKKFLLIMLGIIFLLTISGCGNKKSAKSDDDKVVLRFGYARNCQPVIDAMNEFGDLLYEKTNGEMAVQYFPAEQLGGERELVELTQTAAIDTTIDSGSPLEGTSDIYSLLIIIYL